MTFAELLHAYRVKYKISVSEAARRLDISRYTLMNWEKGIARPSLKGDGQERILRYLKTIPEKTVMNILYCDIDTSPAYSGVVPKSAFYELSGASRYEVDTWNTMHDGIREVKFGSGWMGAYTVRSILTSARRNNAPAWLKRAAEELTRRFDDNDP